MASSQAAPSAPRVQQEDPLAYLPCSHVLEFPKGDLIYDQSRPPMGLYVVVNGKVRVSQCAPDGRHVVLDIYQPNEVFGESVFLGQSSGSEEARAWEDSKLMCWTFSKVQQISTNQPGLAMALLQVMVQRTASLNQRIESLCFDNTGQRIVRSLLWLGTRMGTSENDGSVRLMPLKHEFLAQYVGTSRELVTMHMNKLRREGSIRYSRQELILRTDLLQAGLAGSGPS